MLNSNGYLAGVPPGLVLNSKGDLAGVPQSRGKYSFQVRVTNDAGAVSASQVKIIVN